MTETEQKIWADTFIAAIQEECDREDARLAADTAVRETRLAAQRLAAPPLRIPQ